MSKKKESGEAREVRIFIPPANMKHVAFTIRGSQPLVMHQMSQKARKQIMNNMKKGTLKAKAKQAKKPKDFEKEYLGSMHKSTKGWIGVPVMAIKNCMVDACRTTGDKMTHLKLAFWVESEGFSKFGTGLTKMIKGKPKMHICPAPVANGRIDMRARAMFAPGWQAIVRLCYDADMIDIESLGNLLMRGGLQVGLLEGRNFSKKSCGMGWGGFGVLSKPSRKAKSA